MNLGQSIIEIRQHLMEPAPGAPSDRQILLKLQDVSQLLHLESQNTGIAWDVASFPIITAVGQSDYLIPVDAAVFGKDFRVITAEPSNPYFSSREIRRCDMGDNDNFYQGPVQDNSNRHSAVVCNFFRSGQAIYMKLVPTPGVTGKVYEVWYETAGQPMDSLGDSPVLAPFQRYRNLKTALALIPYCKWGALADKELLTQMTALRTSLMDQAVEYKKAWNDWIASDREDGTTTRIGYAEGASGGYGYTYGYGGY